MKASSLRLLLVSALIIIATISFGQAPPVMIGVLEDTPGQSANDPHYRDVRVVFYRNGQAWKAFPSDCPDEACLKTIAAKYPRQVDWTVTLDGRAVGNVTARTPEVFETYSSVGQQALTGTSPLPTVGQRSQQFATFYGEPVYHPLITVSQPNYRDPEQWKPAKLSDAQIAAVRRELRKKYPKVMNCKGDGSDAFPWPYQDNNIAFGKAYASARGWSIAEAHLVPNRCDGPADDPFAMQWFVITPQGDVRWLASNMWLVDAGDYGGDGNSELVFALNDYDRGGYRLYYDDFRQRAAFEFNYH